MYCRARPPSAPIPMQAAAPTPRKLRVMHEMASACARHVSNVDLQRMSALVVVPPRTEPVYRFLPPLERVRLFDFLRRRFLTLAQIGP